jgi:hypothetical protein
VKKSIRAIGRSLDAVLLEDLRDCAPCNAVAKALEFALDATVPPGRILEGHANDESLDRPHQSGTAHAFRLERPLERDQPSMPSKQGVRGHDGGNLIQGLPHEELRLGSQSAALVVGQPELPTLHLFLEDAVLLDEVGDDVGLVAVH